MKTITQLGFLALSLFFASCASTGTGSQEARQDVEDSLVRKVGIATKSDLTEQFGKPDWCKQEPTGVEKCRFLTITGTKWKGSKKYQKSYNTYDEVNAEFGADGTLRSYRVNVQK